MPIVPVYGHAALRTRLQDAVRQHALPSSLLLHGPRGVGKQRVALWLGQVLLCHAGGTPCGECQGCRFTRDLTHPDLAWFFPRPRLRDSDPDIMDVRHDYAEAIAERVSAQGLYVPPPGSDAIYVATVRAIVQQAALSPALGTRKVFVIGDAERMVPQEGSEQAANAFLKLLEEPPADTTVILTSSEPGALLPTIRSRVVSFRLGYLTAEEMRAFMSDPAVARRLGNDRALPAAERERLDFAAGAPGRLLAAGEWAAAVDQATRMLEGALKRRGARYDAAWGQATTKARGSFAEALDALSIALHARARAAALRGAGGERDAIGAARAMEVVEVAKERVISNVSPQLITANLLRELEELLA